MRHIVSVITLLSCLAVSSVANAQIHGGAATGSSSIAINDSILSSASVSAGQVENIQVVITPNFSLSDAIASVRVVDSAGNMVEEKLTSPANLVANQAFTMSFAYTPSSSVAPGSYAVVAAVWSADWRTTYLYAWTNSSFQVVSAGSSQSADGTTVPPASQIVDAAGGTWTVSSGVVYLNGSTAGYSANVTQLVYKGGKVYQQNSAGNWWYWDGSGWVASGDPSGNPSQSADGTTVPPASQIVDAGGGTWTVSNGVVYLNGSTAGYSANVTQLVYKDGKVYQQNSAGGWWYWDGSGWVASGDPMGDGSITLSGEEGMFYSGAYFVDNNKWGADSAGFTYPQNAGIGSVDSSGAVSARWNWDCTSWDCVNSGQEVKGYPAVGYGQKPGFGPTPGSKLPKGVWELNSVPMSYNVTETMTGRAHLSFDVWLESSPEPSSSFVSSPLTHEIMISVDEVGDYVFGAGMPVGNIVVDGLTYNVRYADNFGGLSQVQWRFIVLQLVQDGTTTPRTLLAATIDLKHILDVLKSRGLISGNEYLTSIEFGNEMVTGTGDVFVHSFKVDVQ